MAINFDVASGSNGWISGNLNVLHKTSGANRFLIVGVATYNSVLSSVTSATYGGVNLTKIGSISSNLNGNFQSTELWYLDNPAISNNSLIVTFDNSPTYVDYSCASYTGKTITGIDASATSQNTGSSTASPSCNVSVVHNDCWLIAYGYSRAGTTPTGGSGTTIRNGSYVGHALGDSNGVVVSGAGTLSFNVDSAVAWPGVISASISASNAGGGAAHNVTIANSQQANAASTASISQTSTTLVTASNSSQSNAASTAAIYQAGSTGTLTIPAVKDWETGLLKTGHTGITVDVRNIATGELVVRKTGQTTHVTTGVCVVTDALIIPGTTYEVCTRFADGSKGMWDYTAS